MASFSSWVLSLQVLLFSTGVLSLAMALKVSVPLVSDFIASDVPNIWSFFLTWLRPPYLHILANCIIISVAASSKFLNHKFEEQAHSRVPLAVPPCDPVKMPGEKCKEYVDFNGVISKSYVEDSKVQRMAPEVQQERISNAEITRIRNEEIANEESVCALSIVMTSMQSRDSLVFSFLSDDEKSPVPARSGHRKASKGSPQGGKVALGVAKPKQQDFLENTWSTMTERRAMPLTRHLKKSDTMDSPNGCNPPNSKLIRKSETFSEQSRARKQNYSSASSSQGSAKMREEPSLSQDELNRRAEAFIRKFYQEMRLQRQESLRQYIDMTEGRAMPLTRHLKKSDTMDSQNGCTPPNSKLIRKSETFREQSRACKKNYSSASSSSGSAKMREEPSLSQDELNRRVEKFIRKFNQEMRLQRLRGRSH